MSSLRIRLLNINLLDPSYRSEVDLVKLCLACVLDQVNLILEKSVCTILFLLRLQLIVLYLRWCSVICICFLLYSQLLYNIYRAHAVFNGTNQPVGISFGCVSLRARIIVDNLHEIVFLDLNLAIACMRIRHWLLAGWCHLVLHEMTLAGSLWALQLVANLPDALIR